MCEVWSCIEPYHVCGFIYKAGPEGLLFKKFSPQALNVIVVGQLGSRGMPALLFFEMGSY
jgi:hypothetical protein